MDLKQVGITLQIKKFRETMPELAEKYRLAFALIPGIDELETINMYELQDYWGYQTTWDFMCEISPNFKRIDEENKAQKPRQ